MSKLWLVIRREYLYNIRRKSFLWGAFGTPLFIVAMWGAIILLTGNDSTTTSDLNQLGYVDNAGIIMTDTLPDSIFTFIRYADEEEAQAALTAEQIDAYYVIAADYMASGAVQRYANGDAPDGANFDLRLLLITNLSAGLETPFPAERLLNPSPDFRIQMQDTGREMASTGLVVLLMLPLFFAIMFSIAGQTTGSFLMNGLSQEKTNRIMEILVTTITPMQMLLGKVIGLGLLGLTQVTIWVVAVVGILTLGPQIESLAFLDGISVPPDLIFYGIIYFILGYFFNGSILAAIGVVAGSEQQSNQYAAIVNLTGYLIPIFLLTSFIQDSNGVIPVILSIVPITAPLSMIVRVGLGAVPAWQLVASIGLLTISTVIVAWASAKVFRWGLLMYGKKFSLRDLSGVILGNREMGVTKAESQEVTA